MKKYKIQYGGNKLEELVTKHLKEDVYCRLKNSKIHGVGVFAIKDIPKGINPFKVLKEDTYINIPEENLKDLNKNIKKMLNDFVGINSDKTFSIPSNGLNSISISFFINHSKNPNIEIRNSEKDNEYVQFFTKRLIKDGEELFIDYDEY